MSTTNNSLPWFAVERNPDPAMEAALMRLQPEVFRLWFYLMRVTDNEGRLLTSNLQDLWFMLPRTVEQEELENGIDALLLAGLIDIDSEHRMIMTMFVPLGRAKRQPTQAERDGNARRQQALRDRRKAERSPGKAEILPPSAASLGVSVPPEEASRNAVTPAVTDNVTTGIVTGDVTQTVTPYKEEKRKEEKRLEKKTPQPAIDPEKAKCLDHFMATYPKITNELDTVSRFDELWGKPAPHLGMSQTEMMKSGIPDSAYYWRTVAPSLEAQKTSEHWAFKPNIPDAVVYLKGRVKFGGEIQTMGRGWMTKVQTAEPNPVSLQEFKSNLPPEELKRLMQKRRAS